MVWGVITLWGVRRLIHVNGIITAKKYTRVL